MFGCSGRRPLQVDLSNAFEDGKACLEELGERRRRGRVSQEEEATVMGSLKERFRAEYRKVGEGLRKFVGNVSRNTPAL